MKNIRRACLENPKDRRLTASGACKKRSEGILYAKPIYGTIFKLYF